MGDPSLLGPSKTRVVVKLLGKERTAKELASSLDIQVSAARKHLKDLEQLGLVGEEDRGGTVGRPKRFYHLTEKGRELFPRQYDTILNAIIAKLVQNEGDTYAESVMNAIARDMARTVGRDGNRPTVNLSSVSEMLNQLGFQGTIKDNRKDYTVESGNCPLLKTAATHREIVCRGLHEELLKATLGGKSVDRTNWIVSGDSYCKHTISTNSSAANKLEKMRGPHGKQS